MINALVEVENIFENVILPFYNNKKRQKMVKDDYEMIIKGGVPKTICNRK